MLDFAEVSDGVAKGNTLAGSPITASSLFCTGKADTEPTTAKAATMVFAKNIVINPSIRINRKNRLCV